MPWADQLLATTGLRVSPFALGTMTFGAKADEATCKKLYTAAREAGINVFDCANVYAKGRSEEILGDLIASERDDVLITTKAYFPTGPDRNARGSSRRHLIKAVEDSLRRLKVDAIDIFFLHRFDEETDLRDTLATLNQLVNQGKILYPALSNFSAWQAMKAIGICEANGWTKPVAIQPMYNLLKRQAEVEILPMAISERISVFPYSPLAAGFLTGKYNTSKDSVAGRINENAVYKYRYGADQNLAIAKAFCDLADSRGVSPTALAIAWCAKHPGVTSPILGARNLEQLNGCLEVLNIEMDDDLYSEISALSPTPPPATDRNEEGTQFTYDAILKAAKAKD